MSMKSLIEHLVASVSECFHYVQYRITFNPSNSIASTFATALDTLFNVYFM